MVGWKDAKQSFLIQDFLLASNETDRAVMSLAWQIQSTIPENWDSYSHVQALFLKLSNMLQVFVCSPLNSSKKEWELWQRSLKPVHLSNFSLLPRGGRKEWGETTGEATNGIGGLCFLVLHQHITQNH